MGTSEHIARLVEPVLEAHGHELYDVELTGAVVRVLVERPGSSVTLADLEQVSRAISQALDDEDPIPGRFELEVSSPGLERPLRTPGHFARAVGSAVKLKTRPDADGDRRVEGTITAADADGITVETTTGSRRLAYGEIERARTVFEWGPTTKPGSIGKPGTKKRSAS
jgi:ribosome maturation factor RimP